MPATDERTTRREWKVARRRVAVKIELAAGSTLTGSIYADVKTDDGTPGRVSDRLNDDSERFIPLAVEDRHVLLSKASIVLVRLKDELAGPSTRSGRDLTDLQLRMTLSEGTTVQGKVHAVLPRPRSRALDFLNLNTEAFIALRGPEDRVILVNASHIERVTEVLADSLPTR